MATDSSSSKKWIFTYFELYGRGEACRMALTHGDVDWEDNAVSGPTWASFKASGKCANGQVPVLEVEGDTYLNQSEAILRFIGHKTGAYPAGDALACHRADAIINTASDFEKKEPKSDDGKPLMYRMFGDAPLAEDDVAKMVEARKAYHTAFCKLLGGDAFFGGERPSIADFWICASIYSFERNTKGKEAQAHVYKAYAAALGENQALSAWADRMGDELKDYLATRRGGTL